MRASPNWMSRKDTLTGSHEKNAFSPVTLGQLKKGPPGAVPGRVIGLREEVRRLVPKDLILYLHGLHLLEETSNKCERATGMRVLCPAKRDRMWAAALKDACAVDIKAGGAYNRTCPGPRATGGGTNPQHH